MYRTVIISLDGSPLAERALPFAATLAQASSGHLVLVRVAAVPTSADLDARDERLDAAEREAGVYLRTVAERVAGQDSGLAGRVATVVPRALHVSVAQALLETAAQRDAGVIVMATHGRSGLGRWIYGSVADDVLRHAQIPVLLVPAAGEPAWAAGVSHRVLVPLDGSDLAHEVLPVAADLATVLRADVRLIWVVEPPAAPYGEGYAYIPFDPEVDLVAAKQYLEGVAATLRARGLTVEVGAEVGQAAATITTMAREQHATVIAMATHGRSGLARLVLGSVATGTLQRSPVPLLLVRPMAMRQTAQLSASSPAHSAPNPPQAARPG